MSTTVNVILTKDIQGVGKAGQEKNVRLGFARNFLLPNALALLSTKANLLQITAIKKREEKRRQEEKDAALANRAKVHELVINFEEKTHDNGKLYGSVSAQDILDKLIQKTGLTFDKKAVQLVDPIREVGQVTVSVVLHADVEPASVVVDVVSAS